MGGEERPAVLTGRRARAALAHPREWQGHTGDSSRAQALEPHPAATWAPATVPLVRKG